MSERTLKERMRFWKALGLMLQSGEDLATD
jgi:hypothetical protein